ncbi:hypothetical protein SAMN05660860_02091 [Geoalkalibacter ferrihydriticus]|uniref:Uncharacterized protein n=2 Tax=Geoalkalibacter ferrihydriticus TaxID=392333 RepID=A0A0C2HQZ6_9BACT|nr:hypothetical protein [Geoalkalibacter ferrihydriticus]KIH77305.1 hypothetical protein GFER_00670 [Geoalkalibacter ferrihydriticus DSM 17813]SDM20608.1 hypothetical protein SAMN05660860_02091 [Geoalkalibacter ferrihydriticus]
MGITEVFLNVISSIVANKISEKIPPINKEESKSINSTIIEENISKNEYYLKAKPLGDGWDSFYKIMPSLLKSIESVNIFLFIEAQPSTFYNLVSIVIEDNRTGDWFPFGQKISFQGNHGGWAMTENFYNCLKKATEDHKDIKMSIRVAKNEDLKGLLEGVITWANFKDKSIPAFITEDMHYKQLRDRFINELVDKKNF